MAEMVDKKLLDLYEAEEDARIKKEEENKFPEKIDFSKVTKKTKFYWIATKTITTKNYGDKTIHTLARDMPTTNEEGELEAFDLGEFWQGAATLWMEKIPDAQKQKLDRKKISIELVFNGLTQRKSVDLKPTGKVILVTPFNSAKRNRGYDEVDN
jgi:hypothetical protein